MWTLSGHRRFAIGLTSAVARAVACGQLAITEVMPTPEVAVGSATVGAEYWELTNFGTNDANLDGYGFRDSNPTRPLAKEPFTNLILPAGRSVVFFRIETGAQSVTNAGQFRTWWGETKVPPDLQCRPWSSPRLSGWDGDAVRLYDRAGELVDSVQFARAHPGRSFSYEPGSGIFGVFSGEGVDGAFAAELSGDIGSPGTTTGPVPVRVLRTPSDQRADAGGTVVFTVVAAGLPGPRFQWHAGGDPIPYGTNPTLVLTNVQPPDAATYRVWISNGLSDASAEAILTVNTDPTPPTIVEPPVDLEVFDGQNARFSVGARGLPPPQYQWRANTTLIPVATGPVLDLAAVGLDLSGTRYTVCVSNALGLAEASARLAVTRRPDLRFTEVLALPANEEQNRHFDWFELTNFDSNSVNLLGWRFSDEPSLNGAFTITNSLILEPAESAVFAERLDARLFAAWWGTNNLPEGLQVCAYGGVGLSSHGDTLFLWNAAATDPFDYVAVALWAGSSAGVSSEFQHRCLPGFGCEDEAEGESVPGIRGAFRAIDGGDVGSPGYVSEPPLRVISVRLENGGITLLCRVSAGKTYRLLRAASVETIAWTPLETRAATNNVLPLPDPLPAGGPWFYRVMEVP